MIKTGIYELVQVKQGFKFFKGLFGGEKKLSITLYDQILNEPNAEELAERILQLFADERGAYKRTYAKRFEEFDNEIINLLKQTFSQQEALLIQDVGVSDARTSVDFFVKLANIFKNLKFEASDYNPKVYIIEQNNIKLTLSHTGKLLEVVWPPFVFNFIKRDSYKHYPFNHIIRFIVYFFKIRKILNDYKLGVVKARELLLFAPNAINLAKQDQRFNLLQHDLMQPFNNCSHIIRAMNILNISYFSESEFNKILNNIYAGLVEQGLLIVGSNQEAGSIVHGGVYKKTNNNFEKIWQSGNGAAIDDLILQFKL